MVGNVEARVLGSECVNFSYRRGIIGSRAPDPLVSTHSWGQHNILVMYSDGLRSHWRWEDVLGKTGSDAAPGAQTMAQNMLHRLARERDDATLVVVKGADFEQQN